MSEDRDSMKEFNTAIAAQEEFFRTVALIGFIAGCVGICGLLLLTLYAGFTGHL